MRIGGGAILAALVLAAGLMAGLEPAAAKTCKAKVSAIGLSTGKAEVRIREARARKAALGVWRSKAQKANGMAYRFWSRADEKEIACQSAKGRSRCLISARPCRLL